MDKRQSEYCAGLLRAMGNQVRLEILLLLLNGEVSVGVIASHVELSQSAVSQHLAKLRDKKLVVARKEAQTVYYSIASAISVSILHVLIENVADIRPANSRRSPSASVTS